MLYMKNKKTLRKFATSIFSERTLRLVLIDLIRLWTRIKNIGKKNLMPQSSLLHLGCGKRHISGWLNCDLMRSDHDVDFAGGKLPWRDGVFEAAVSQHMVEHLEFETEILPLFQELRRVIKPGAQLWLSCPDLETICNSYINHRMQDLIGDRARMWGEFSMDGLPSQHFINLFFHERGTHKNLFDFEMLEWALKKVGFTNVKRTNETEFLQRFPEFPKRGDDMESVYVCAS